MLPICPSNFDADFARTLLGALGADTSSILDDDCWPELADKFAKFKPLVESYFANATTGDPAFAAYRMARYCGSSRSWAEGVIANALTGNPAWAAYCMACDCGSSREWAEGVIANAKTGEPAWAAYGMTLDCGSSREWASSIKPLVIS